MREEAERQTADDVRAKQRAVWGAAAAGWVEDREALGGPTTPLTARLIELAGIREGYGVLDMACGSGDPALSIARLVGPRGFVAGRDFVPAMIDGAKDAAREDGMHNVEFRVIDNELEPDVGDKKFDAITCRFGLMFMAEPVTAVRLWRSLLRPGGHIAISTWASFPILKFVLQIIARHVTLPEIDPKAPGVLALPTPEALSDVLHAGGYTEIAVESMRTPLFEDLPPERWWDLMARTAGPLVVLLASLPDETRQAVRADGIRALRERHPSGIVAEFGDALLASGVNPG